MCGKNWSTVKGHRLPAWCKKHLPTRSVSNVTIFNFVIDLPVTANGHKLPNWPKSDKDHVMLFFWGGGGGGGQSFQTVGGGE